MTKKDMVERLILILELHDMNYEIKHELIKWLNSLIEPIDEEKLDELARKYILTMSGMMGFYDIPSEVPDALETCIDIFKTGYRKAKEE